jgi:hypothetical protein
MVIRVDNDCTCNAAETAADVGNHQVTDGELRARVRGVDAVGSLHDFSLMKLANTLIKRGW